MRFGSVILKEWIKTPFDHRQVIMVTGDLTPVKDEQVLGFTLRNNSQSERWGVSVKGEVNEWIILGCQIRAVIYHSKSACVTSEALVVD